MYWNIKRRKIRHYKHKIDLTEMQIWDLEFLREKTKAVREGIRMDYDRINELNGAKKLFRDLIVVFGVNEASELLKVGPDKSQAELEKHKGEIKSLSENEQKALDALNSQIADFDKDVKQMQEQMDSFDGDAGQINQINQKIEGYQTVKMLMKQYIKQL